MMSVSSLVRGSIPRSGLFSAGHQNVILRTLSTVPAERKADFAPRVISKGTFPDVEVKKLRRGTGGRSSFNGMIVTVFGATGFLGRHVISLLGRIGCQVVVPYRCDPYFLRDLKLAGDLGQILFVPFALKDTDTLYRAMKYSNVVVNLLGRDNPTANFDFQSVHVDGARTIARIARESGVKRLIHVSALNSSPNPPEYWVKGGSNFLKSKYYGELAVREEYPDATIFRPADMYGVQDKYLWYYCQFYRRDLGYLSLHNGGYGIYKTPVAGQDVARGIVNAITDEESIGLTYDAIGPRRYEQRMLIELLQDIILKHPEDGYSISNMRFDIMMRLRISLLTYMSKKILRDPKITWEKFERECITDEKTDNPNLLDLGVRLQFVEDRWPDDLKIWRAKYDYDGDLGEMLPIMKIPSTPAC